MSNRRNLSVWRKTHQDRVTFGVFKNKSHPIKKSKLPDKTVYFCLKCRDTFTVFELNKIKPKKPIIFTARKPKIFVPRKEKTDSQKTIDRLDRLWNTCIKTRASFKSEWSGKGMAELHMIHAHHINGKSSHALRWSLENGVCVTGEEHSSIAHGPADVAKEFKEWAIGLRHCDDEKISKSFGGFGACDFEEVEVYLRENLHLLKHPTKIEEEIYLP